LSLRLHFICADSKSKRYEGTGGSLGA